MIKRIVFSGGPSAGKSEAISFVKDDLEKHGIRTIICKETAEELIASNIIPKTDVPEFQRMLFNMQAAKEKYLDEYLMNSNELDDPRYKFGVILYDRSLFDGRAYMSNKEYDDMLSSFGYDYEALKKAFCKKFDGLVIMQSGAYNEINDAYVNNCIRLEDKLDAMELQLEIESIYEFFPSYYVPCFNEFSKKKQAALDAVYEILKASSTHV